MKPTLKSEHLEFAIALTESMWLASTTRRKAAFGKARGREGFNPTCEDDYDGAEPSGNSVAALSLLPPGCHH
jgi:hypothetical protein